MNRRAAALCIGGSAERERERGDGSSFLPHDNGCKLEAAERDTWHSTREGDGMGGDWEGGNTPVCEGRRTVCLADILQTPFDVT